MPKKILLADDSITIQKVVELTFSDGDYEVTAVNNGLKAIAKLAEIHPDIVLSDIIMPEKNGYEVCEYVKSHPEFRHIPVILLTGTFEPFDPDRAEKAGCDAVVTKPFESQNLIHKVEDLIQSSRQAATAGMNAASASQPAVESPSEVVSFSEPDNEPEAESPSEPAAAPTDTESFSGPAGPGWEEPAAPGASWTSPPASLFSTDAVSSFSGDEPASPFGSDEPAADTPELPPLSSDPFGSAPAEAVEHDASIFEPAQEQGASTPMPQFEEQPAEPPAGETRAFPMMSFEEMRRMTEVTAPPEPPEPAYAPSEPVSESPFGAQAEDPGATRAFPTMSFDQLQQMAARSTHATEEISASAFETSHFDEAPVATAAPVDMESEEESRESTFSPPPFDEPESQTSGLHTEMPEEYSGVTRAFPMMSFDQLNQHSSSMAPATPVEEEPEMSAPPVEAEAFNEVSATPDSEEFSEQTNPTPWSPTAPPSLSTPPSTESIWSEDAGPVADRFPTGEVPFPEPEPEIAAAAEPEESSPFTEAPPEVAMSAASSEPEIVEPEITEPESAPVSSFAEPEAAAVEPVPSAAVGALTDQQIDRIARRVVEMMSEQMVRNIAWEIVPDLAEMIVKERIKQLENE